MFNSVEQLLVGQVILTLRPNFMLLETLFLKIRSVKAKK